MELKRLFEIVIMNWQPSLQFELTTLFLVGATSDNEQIAAIIYAPSALHRARWMAKCIYTINIALFRAQLLELKIYTASKITQIYHLVIFLSTFYAFNPFLFGN